MMAIVQKKMNIERSIYEILQIVSISLTDTTTLKDLFAKPNYNIVNELDGSTEPCLFKLLNFIITVRNFYRTAMGLGIKSIKMKRIYIAFLSIFMLVESISLYAWGPMGHDVVAAIAEQHLTKKARKEIAKLLDGKSIVYYSSWMDKIQNSPYWNDGYNATKTWHYANVDMGHTYQTMPKEKNGDVVSALEKLTDAMTNHYAELTDSMKVDYLKMIVHMVGDLHCPMHAGRLSDRGGNQTKVRWFRQNTNIHSVWDSKMIESARKWSHSEWVFHLDRTDRRYRKEVVAGSYEDWFSGTVQNAARIYDYIEATGKENPNLTYQFVYDFSPLLEEQLLLGGYRLAYVLNNIFSK